MVKILEVLAALAVPALLAVLAWRAAAQRRANPPLLAEVEPRIRPLVDALNATGLVETFTSCEGHYGHRARRGDSTDREQAQVGFFRRESVPEEELARFFGDLCRDPRLHGGDETVFTIAKHHVPALDGGDVPEVFFELSVRPFDPRASNDAKRDATDRMLALITAGVERSGASPDSPQRTGDPRREGGARGGVRGRPRPRRSLHRTLPAPCTPSSSTRPASAEAPSRASPEVPSSRPCWRASTRSRA